MELNPSSLSIQIKFCRYCCHDAAWTESKTKTDYTLWNLYRGSLVMEINGKTLKASAGDVLLFYPGDTYTAYCGGSCCEFLVTFFTMDMGNSVDIFRVRNSAGIYSFPKLLESSNVFCRAYLEEQKSTDGITLKLYAVFLTFLSVLFAFLGKQTPFYDELAPVPDLKFQQLLSYMEKNTAKNIPIKELASFMGMSEKYFIQFFHAHTGQSPKQYMIRRRMDLSIQLLSDPSLLLSEIAGELHFSDEYAFSKAFKKYFGESPAYFRKHYLSQHLISR